MDIETLIDVVIGRWLRIPNDRIGLWAAGVAGGIGARRKVSLLEQVAEELGVDNGVVKKCEEALQMRDKLAHRSTPLAMRSSLNPGEGEVVILKLAAGKVIRETIVVADAMTLLSDAQIKVMQLIAPLYDLDPSPHGGS